MIKKEDYHHTDGYEDDLSGLDGFDRQRKTKPYDKNKSRKNNKINPREIELVEDEDEFFDFEEEDENG